MTQMCLLEYGVMHSCRNFPTFPQLLLSPSGQTSVYFHRTTRRHNPQYRSLHRHQCNSLNSHRCVFRSTWFERRPVECQPPPITIKRSTSLRTNSYTTHESYFLLMVNRQADTKTNGFKNLSSNKVTKQLGD